MLRTSPLEPLAISRNLAFSAAVVRSKPSATRGVFGKCTHVLPATAEARRLHFVPRDFGDWYQTLSGALLPFCGPGVPMLNAPRARDAMQQVPTAYFTMNSVGGGPMAPLMLVSVGLPFSLS